ncbi:L,D-transpeptidase family protein [Brevibacterium album]|uniref:L,D-transpeptidase family protein n=1 Tax=Brevibacterium album TaxID=417948 RepID=UPI000422B16D|nr:L,D-transpeptidase family protein [Brevibacterium album]
MRASGIRLASASAVVAGAAAGILASTTAFAVGASSFAAPAQRAPNGFAAPSQLQPKAADENAEPAAGALGRPTGLGEETFAQVPADTTQLIVVSAEDRSATESSLVLWEREEDGWTAGRGWEVTNGENGWREDRREGDRTTPEGVFSLSDAGGYLDDPGTDLPYYQDAGLRSGAEAVYGDGYQRVFDYVIAIDYNRRTGVAPTENTRPEGWDKGGKIWLHVEHSSPTRGCVSMPAEDLRFLLEELETDRSPHIAMGSAEYLEQ